MITALLLASTLVTTPCEWKHPGADPYMGSITAAINKYEDIPLATRNKLVARAERHEYDEIVDITKAGIVGKKATYSPDIEGMNFGSKGRVCATVTRASWTDQMLERGLVYCEDGTCILIPTVCRNVSLIRRTSGGGGVPMVTAPPEFMMPPGKVYIDSPTAPHADWGLGWDTFLLSGPTFVDDSPPPFFGFPPVGGPPITGYPGIPPEASPPDCPPITVTPVPEPSTYLLLAVGLVAVGFYSRKKK